MIDRETGMLSHTTRVVSTFFFTFFGLGLLTINGFGGGDLVLPGFVSLGVAYYVHNWGSKPRG